MAKKNKKGDDGSGMDPNAWMATFSDLNFLMITFFVLLLSMSSMDARRFADVFGEVLSEDDDVIRPAPPLGDAPVPPIIPPRANILGGTAARNKRRVSSPIEEQAMDPTAVMGKLRRTILSAPDGRDRDRELTESIEDNQDLLQLEDAEPESVTLSVDVSVLFEDDSVTLGDGAMEVLRSMADLALQLSAELRVEAGGSWELSARRAAAVATALTQLGVPGPRVRADVTTRHPGRVVFEIHQNTVAPAATEEPEDGGRRRT